MKTTLKITLIILLFQIPSFPQTKKPEWSYNRSIYEVNVRQFTPEGTFDAFKEHLPQLKNMNVGILWLMPINPIGENKRKGSLGSYYSVKDYKEVNSEFGTKDDFRNLVEEIHKKKMYVIVDWVANHTAWDHQWTTEHPNFYNKDSLGNFIPPVNDWSDVIDLNYDNKGLWKEMIDALKYWVKEFDIDGYRCDIAGMVPIEFWNEARKEIESIKPVFMLAEWDTPKMHLQAFDMTYDWTMHKLMNAVYKGEKNALDIKNHLLKDRQKFSENAFRMQFTSNHDENTWNGTEFERLGDAVEMFAVLTNMIPDMPLVYNGQESGFDRRLEFFEKDSIDWKEHPFYNLYKNLFDLKKNNKALFNGHKGGGLQFIDNCKTDNILSFIREKDENKIFAVFNLSNKKTSVKIPNELIKDNFTNFISAQSVTFDNSEFELEPWDYKIFFK